MATGLQSSFLLLPPETVALIFEYCLPSDPWHAWSTRSLDRSNDHLWPSPSPDEAPLLLTQICRRWREICLDTPSLWASVTFGETGSIDLLEMWLSRARNQPLRILLQAEDDARADGLLRTVKPHSSRWQEVHFTLPTSAHQQLNMLAFPCLERLTLIAPLYRRDRQNPSIVIEDAPSLRYAQIIDLPRFTAHLPLQQLTSLTLYPLANGAMIIALLRSCPNLLDLDAESYLSTHIGPPSESPLQLHFLRSVKIHEPEFLSFLTVPRLERLGLYRMQDRDCDMLQSFVARSCCELQSFSVKKFLTNADQSQRFFRAFEPITHLHIEYVPDFPLLIQLLQDDDIVLPRLRRLEIGTDRNMSVADYTQLLEMLRHRRQTSALEMFELRKDIPLSLWWNATLPLMDEFRTLAEAGLRLRVTTTQFYRIVHTIDIPEEEDSDEEDDEDALWGPI
ncbi:hypothetical protein DFH06DRAFT_1210838 [Mycena polygramma]|nr:hypothetical protein DFH06DRAFT_1210838 [Mycena polygramma]